jgi:arylsulfatase A-like enzyme
LTGVGEDRPFLLRVSFNAPHTPVVPPAPFDTCIDPDAITLPAVADPLPEGAPQWVHDYARCASASRLSEPEVRRMRQVYYGEVAYLDGLIGDLLSWMGERDLLDNLLIVFCSDHGNHLADYGLVQKDTFYEPSVCVPYLFWGPGIVRAREPVQTPVELRSLLPTLLDLAGIELPEALQASSLARALRTGEEPAATPVYSALDFSTEFKSSADAVSDRLLMVRDGSWKLTATLDREPCELLLVDLASDPYERVNRAYDPAASGVRARLLGLLDEHAAGGDLPGSAMGAAKP